MTLYWSFCFGAQAGTIAQKSYPWLLEDRGEAQMQIGVREYSQALHQSENEHVNWVVVTTLIVKQTNTE